MSVVERQPLTNTSSGLNAITSPMARDVGRQIGMGEETIAFGSPCSVGVLDEGDVVPPIGTVCGVPLLP